MTRDAVDDAESEQIGRPQQQVTGESRYLAGTSFEDRRRQFRCDHGEVGVGGDPEPVR
jgi:hypothetical protein